MNRLIAALAALLLAMPLAHAKPDMTAQKTLQSLGFTQVYNVKEGMAGSAAGPGWLARNLPVESCAQC